MKVKCSISKLKRKWRPIITSFVPPHWEPLEQSTFQGGREGLVFLPEWGEISEFNQTEYRCYLPIIIADLETKAVNHWRPETQKLAHKVLNSLLRWLLWWRKIYDQVVAEECWKSTVCKFLNFVFCPNYLWTPFPKIFFYDYFQSKYNINLTII